MMESKARDELISVKEAAQKCGRNTETVRRWIWSGKLNAEKLGNQLFIKKSALENYCRGSSVAFITENKTGTLERIRHARERIRTRIGRNFTEDEISGTIKLLRQERIDELSGLR
jgi:excisionase family DNA binding protein